VVVVVGAGAVVVVVVGAGAVVVVVVGAGAVVVVVIGAGAVVVAGLGAVVDGAAAIEVVVAAAAGVAFDPPPHAAMSVSMIAVAPTAINRMTLTSPFASPEVAQDKGEGGRRASGGRTPFAP
jgi:hypothetical protein